MSVIKAVSICASTGNRMRILDFYGSLWNVWEVSRSCDMYSWASSDAVRSLLSADIFWLFFWLILYKCDESSSTVAHIAVSLRLSEKWPLKAAVSKALPKSQHLLICWLDVSKIMTGFIVQKFVKTFQTIQNSIDHEWGYCLLLCTHVKEPTKYPKSTDQISGGIWSVNETSFTGFKVDQCKHSFGHNSVDLQRIVTKFGEVNLLVKNFHMQIWLLR